MIFPKPVNEVSRLYAAGLDRRQVIGNMPPAEAEAAYYAQLEATPMAA